MDASELEVGRKYSVAYRWKYGKRNEFTGTYVGIKESPLQGHMLPTFDLGGGAAFYIGAGRILEVEAL